MLAVNLGDDADTTGAVYGQIAGAYYGAAGMPKAWVGRLARLEVIENFAEKLIELQGMLPQCPISTKDDA